MQQTLIVKQNELTQAWQELTRTTTELSATRKMLGQQAQQQQDNEQARTQYEEHIRQMACEIATLRERSAQISANHDALWQLIHHQPAQPAGRVNDQQKAGNASDLT